MTQFKWILTYMWLILTWLRHPRQRWGWFVAVPMYVIMAPLWLQFDLKYGDGWYRHYYGAVTSR